MKKGFLFIVTVVSATVFMAGCSGQNGNSAANTTAQPGQTAQVETQRPVATTQENIPTVPTYNEDRSALFIPYKTGDSKDADIIAYQKGLASLILAYKEAMLSTYALAYVDYTKTSLDDFTKLKDLCLDNWGKVKTADDAFGKLAADQISFRLIPAAYASSFDGYNPRDEQMLPRLTVSDPGYTTFKAAEPNPWEKVEAEKRANPSKQVIKIVADQFKISQEEAVKQVDLYYKKQAQNWQEQVSTYESSSVITDAIAQTARVELNFIMKSTPLVRGFAQVDESDAIVYVTPEKTQVFLGDQNKKVTVPYDAFGESPSPLYYCSFKYLSGEGTDDPSNIVKFANWFEGKAFDMGTASVHVGDKGIVVDPNVKVIPPTFMEDGIIQQFPSGFQYRDTMYNPMYEEMLRKKAAAQKQQQEELQKQQDAQQLLEAHMGVWRGKVKASWMGFSADMDFTMTVGKDGKANYEISYRKNYALGAGETTDFGLNGKASGNVGKDTLTLEGTYTSSMKTSLSITPPPQIAKYLKQYNTPGTMKVTGNFSDLTHVSGDISFTSQYETVNGTWSAEIK